MKSQHILLKENRQIFIVISFTLAISYLIWFASNRLVTVSWVKNIENSDRLLRSMTSLYLKRWNSLRFRSLSMNRTWNKSKNSYKIKYLNQWKVPKDQVNFLTAHCKRKCNMLVTYNQRKNSWITMVIRIGKEFKVILKGVMVLMRR